MMVLVVSYVFVWAVIFLRENGMVSNNRLWAAFILLLGLIFIDYTDGDIRTLIKSPVLFPVRLIGLGTLYGFSIFIFAFGGSIPDKDWAVGVLVQLVILSSYVANDR